MGKLGLKHFVAAPLTETTTASYTGGYVVAAAMKADLQVTYYDLFQRADDTYKNRQKKFQSGTLAIDADDLAEDIKGSLLGHTYATGSAGGEADVPGLTSAGTDETPYVGFGYYGRVVRSGVTKYRAIFLKKVMFSEPNDTVNTEGETPAYDNVSLSGTIEKDVTGEWKNEKVFATEAGAIAWLDGLVGIPTSDSAGLSGLSMTGTGGTLSPTFGAPVRYYTFGGVTGSSVTVTATAASHTISLYVNDVFTQALTSGSASSAISMSIGTKKLRIVAQETGKTPQTTEIIVEKIS